MIPPTRPGKGRPTSTSASQPGDASSPQSWQRSASVKGGSTTLFSAGYARDSANQLTSDSSAASGTGSFKYTPLNQVCYAGSSNSNACSSPPSGSIAYAHDAADNLTQKGSTQQAFNNADELCWTASTSSACATPPSGATTYQYDIRGNRTNVNPSGGQAQTLTYDQANRLTKFAAASTTTYGYNGDGLRMCKYAGSSNQPCQAVGAAQFVWEVGGSLPVLLKDGATAYVYGPGGLPLEQVNTGVTYWFHRDQIGSTRLITDAAGTSQATYTYDPYGGLASSTGSITNPFRFAGQYLDTESGFYYLRARYYDPITALFPSRDPDENSIQGPYRYATDNPLNRVDPTGLCSLNPFARDSCVGQAATSVKNTVQSIRITPPSPPNFRGVSSWGMLMGAGGAFEIAGIFILGATMAVGASVLLAAFLTVVAVVAIVVGVLLIAGAYGYGPFSNRSLAGEGLDLGSVSRSSPGGILSTFGGGFGAMAGGMGLDCA